MADGRDAETGDGRPTRASAGPSGPEAAGDATATATATDEARWHAVLARETSGPGGDGFVYAVSTTGIYCRPGCPSRRPKRAHVVFFATAGQALAAGYRPCRRCRPDAAAAPPADRGADVVAQVRARLDAAGTDADADAEPSLSDLAAALGLSPAHLQRVFSAAVGITPKQYAQALRATRLRAALEEDRTVTEAILAAGYGGTARAHGAARGVLGMAPSAYRRRGAGETIDHVVAPCVLGQLLVAATGRGLCLVALGDDTSALQADLKTRFPAATLRADGPAAVAFLPAVLGVLETPVRPAPGAADLPLDLRGTAFQQRVWAILQRIPPGETRTYAEVAAALGQPSAVRAVAGACGANPAALVVPCHRVVRSDGGLGGYRWGVDRKRALLAREKGGG